MVLSNLYKRYAGATFPVIETKRFLIMNGKTYDKKTLAVLNKDILDVGLQTAAYAEYYICTNVQSAGVMGLAANNGRQVMTGNGTAECNFYNIDGRPSQILSVDDNNRENIEWTIIGDTAIEYNVKDMTFKTYGYLNQTMVSYANMSSATCFLYQDDDYIYYIHKNESSARHYYRMISFNKTTHVFTVCGNLGDHTYFEYSAQYDPKQVSILWQKDNVSAVYIEPLYKYTTPMGPHYYTIKCTGGKMTLTPAMIWNTKTQYKYDAGQNFAATISSTAPTKLDKYGMFTYVTKTNTQKLWLSISRRDPENFALLGTAQELKELTAAGTRETIAEETVRRVLKKQPDEGITEDDWDTALGIKLPAVTYHGIQCYVDGPNDEFLVIFNTCRYLYDLKTTPAGAGGANGMGNGYIEKYKMMVFKRNNPEVDPFDLTLTDVMFFKDYDMISYFHSIFKMSDRKYVCTSCTKCIYVTINDEGRVSVSRIANDNVISWGWDEYNRIYTLDSNKDINIYTDKQPVNVDINYKNPEDAFFRYTESTSTKTAIVKVTNVFGKPVAGLIDLRLAGNGVFENTGTNVYRVTVPQTGELEVNVTLNSVGTITLTGSIVYNNELSIIENSSKGA